MLGSGLGGLADEIEDRVEIPYPRFPGWPVSTAVGHAGVLVLGTSTECRRGPARAGAPVRRDRRRRAVFGVRVLGRLGSALAGRHERRGRNRRVVSAGAARAHLGPHQPLGTSPLVGPNDDELGPRFPDMADAYDPESAEAAREAAGRLGIEVGEGVYAAWLGPQFETPAEIRFMRAIGGDLAGMSTVPEVIAARHIGIRCLGISVVTNMAAGVGSGQARPRATSSRSARRRSPG